MKILLTHDRNHFKVIIALIMIPIIPMFFLTCKKTTYSNMLICNLEESSPYPMLAKEILPSFTVKELNSMPYYYLDHGAIVEAYDSQAMGALETGIAKNWYPQYLATVIIAIDRNQTDVEVSSWNDLYAIQEEVSFLNSPDQSQMLIAAMSYGLEGENYSVDKASQLMSSLYKKNLLKINSLESPIMICYDYQAVDLIEKGRDIEIIIPKEGTFKYEKGLLSKDYLDFEGDVDEILLAFQFRLLDGTSHSTLYPDENAYEAAVRIGSYQHFASTSRNTQKLIERNIMKSKKYMSIDNFEHLLWALIYIIIITIWIASIMRRSMQKGVSHAAFYTGIILTGWIFVRLIKYQVELNSALSRYLWYSFYLFQLTLPLVLLWMAWAIDQAENKIVPPRWWTNIAILLAFLILLVFSNDLHGLVLQLDLNKPDWGINYTYGFAYYIILFVCMINLLTVFIILIKKSIKNPRKKRMILPLFVFILFAIYNYKYITRDPLVYATDLTIVTGLFTMLMFESCIRSGLIPVNTKYIDLFTRSPLKMQIINRDGQVVLQSASVRPLDQDTIRLILNNSPVSITQENNSLLLANPIPGGHTIWYEDISEIYKLNRKIQRSSQMISEANAILFEEKKIKKAIDEANAKKQLMKQLEAEIAKSIAKLTNMIDHLSYRQENFKETSRIALLRCYIKRRCNLFFEEKESNIIRAKELIVWIDELAEIGKYSNVHVANINELKGNIDIRHSILLYDFFYTIVDIAIQIDCPYIIGFLEEDQNRIHMRLLPSEPIDLHKLEADLIARITKAEGKLETKELESSIGINLSFLKGGGHYD